MAVLLLGSVLLLGLATDAGLHAWLAAAGWVPTPASPTGPLVLAGCLLAVVLPHALSGRLALDRLGSGGRSGRRGFGWLRVHERMAGAAPLLLLLGFAAGLCAGWAEAARGWVGDAWILDDLVILAPPLLATFAMDLAAWPLFRRFREASLFRLADAGLPIHPVPGRWAHAWARFRGGAAVLGVPLLLVLGWNEALEAALRSSTGGRLPAPGSSAALALGAAGSVAVVALCPPLLVRALPTVPLPAGPLRDDLLGFLGTEGVRTRGLRLWLTGGAVANAALVGLLPPLRYLLLSDRLVERLPRAELLAVLAHETGHARHRHLPWLGGWAVGSGAALGLGLGVAEARGFTPDAASAGALTAAAVLAWAGAFGWVSRRVEAQADAHAAAAVGPFLGAASPPGTRFSAVGVETVSSALARVSALAGAPEARRSFRHGSIASRRAALDALLDRPAGPAPADVAVGRVKLATLACVPLAGCLWWLT